MRQDSRSVLRGLFGVMIALFLFGNVFAQSYKGDTWAQAQQTKRANLVVTYVETPAFVYMDNTGRLSGICVDILNNFVRYVESQHGVKVNLTFRGNGDNFSEFYKSVQNASQGVIGLGNVTIRPDRRREVTFTPAYIKNIAVLVTHSSVPELSSFGQFSTQFAGKKAYVPPGTTHAGRVDNIKARYYSELVIESTSNSREALLKTVADPNSFSYQDVALYWAFKEDGQPVKRHSIGDEATEELGMIMPLDSDWINVYNEFFNFGNGYKSSPQYRTSLVKHLGKEVVQMLQMAQ